MVEVPHARAPSPLERPLHMSSRGESQEGVVGILCATPSCPGAGLSRVLGTPELRSEPLYQCPQTTRRCLLPRD